MKSQNKKNMVNTIVQKIKMNRLPLLVLFGSFFIGNEALALKFNQSNEGPWLIVENSDLVFMAIINLILVGVLIYFKSIFNNLLKKFAQSNTEEKSAKATGTFSKILTDAVPIEEEDKITLDHEYDGIRELDNNLPPWWVALLVGTMIFAVVYVLHYHVFRTGDLQMAEYNKEMVKADAEVKEYLSKMSMNVDETNATVMTEQKDLDAGKAIYDANCVMCHKDKGQGDIGPNLTDEYWLYSGDIKAIFKTIKIGTSNGMPEHASKLNPIQLQQVASYVYSLPYTPGKEPQGEKYVKE